MSPCAVCSFRMVGAGIGYSAGAVPSAAAPAGVKSFDDSEVPTETSAFFDAPDTALRDLMRWPSSSQRLLLRGADVLTMLDRTILRNHDVLVEGETIAKITPTEETVPSGYTVIDARGKYVMPGLSDMHTHPLTMNFSRSIGRTAQIENADRFVLPYQMLLFQFVAAGVTRIEVMAGDPDALALRDGVSCGRYVGPTMRVGTPLIDGTPPVHPRTMSWVVTDEAGGRTAARKAKALGYDFLKPYDGLPSGAYDAMMAEARELGLPVCGHVPNSVGIEGAIAARQHIAHTYSGYLPWDGMRPAPRDSAYLEQLARATGEAGISVQTTLGVVAYHEKDTAELMAHPDVAFMNPLLREIQQRISFDPAVLEEIKKAPKYEAEIAWKLHAAGVKLLSGTDCPIGTSVFGFSLHQELEWIERSGLSRYETLKSTTVNPAVYCGESGRAGIVAPGARADLLILNENPLEGIQATRAIDTVIVRGAALRRPMLDEGLRRIREELKARMQPLKE